LGLLVAVLVAMATVSLSSCAGYTTNATSGNGGGVGTSGGGVLTPSPASLAFGNVAVGSTATLSVSVTNTGTGTVDISGAAVSGGVFTVIGGAPTSTLAVGQSTSVEVQFAPTSMTPATGALTVSSDATNATLAIALTGTGLEAVPGFSPASLNFNNVTVGQTSSQNVTLSNSGNTDLSITAASVTGTGFAISGLSLPATIAANGSATFSVQFTPQLTTGVTGAIHFTDNGIGSPQTFTMTGSAVAAGSTLGANPGSFNFNNVVVGSNSSQTITLTNSGNASITINSVTAGGAGFSASGITAGQMIAAGGTATFSAGFAPTAPGAVSGSITIGSTATNSTLVVSLSGTGTQAALSANPSSINFGSILDGDTSTVNVTLTNSGTANLSISAANASGTGFTMSTLSPQTLTPGGTATFTVTFAPTSPGNATGTVSVTSTAPGSPLIIGLSGSGATTQAQLAISPSTVPFGNVNVGSNSSQTVTLTNTGNATLNITAATITGSGYTMTLVPTSIAAGGNTTFNVTFTPTTGGSAPGSISITSNAPNSPATISLTGTGLQAQVAATPSSVAFGTIIEGVTNSQTITLKNNGNATLSISAINVTGTGFGQTGLTTSTTIAAGASANFNATFDPSSTSTVNGTITLTTNGTPASLVINLSGTGQAGQPTLGISPTTVPFGNVNVGSNSSQTVTLSNSGTATLNITAATITGSGYTMTLVPTSIAAGSNTTFNVTFTPTTGGSAPGSISITSNAPGSPATINLTGTGLQAQIAATPSSVAFGTVTEGNTDSQQITLKNNGNATLTFSAINGSGTGFGQTGLTTSTTIAAGASANFNATFDPSSTATVNGTITLTTNGTPASLVINLSGTGQATTQLLGVSPASLAFGNVLDDNSSSLPVTVTNNGTANVTISTITTTGAGFTESGIPDGTILTPGQSLPLTVTFAPVTGGAVSGASMTVTSTATNSPATVTLTGTGTHSVVLTWNASPTGGVTYNIFRGTTSGGEGTTPINPSAVSLLTYTDTNVTPGANYYYYVEAVDAGGSSVPSNEASAAIPNP
jgi:hypothetical protein